MPLALLAVLAFLVVHSVSAAVFDPAEWEFRQDVEVPAAKVVKLALPSALIGAGQRGLADLRLADPDGNVVPFLVQHPVARRAASIAPSSTRVTLEGNSTVVLVQTGVTTPIDAATLQAGTGRFMKALLVEGSADGASWKTLRRGAPLFNEPGGPAQWQVEFEAGNWAFLRLTLDDRRTAAIPVTGVVLREAFSEPAPKDLLAGAILDRSESSAESRVVIDLTGANLPVESIEIETPEPLFRRRVQVLQREVAGEEVRETAIGSGTVFRVELEDAPGATNLFIPVGRSVDSREVVLAFANGDSPALKITGVRLHVRPSHGVFGVTKAGRHTFWTGNRLAKAPVYDVAALGSAVRGVAPANATWSALTRHAGFKPSDALKAVEALGGIIEPKQWSVRRTVTIGGPGVSQLELDLAALAGAQTGLSDIRLVNAGRQVPFLFERTSLTRPVPLKFAAAPDKKRPTVGLWKLELPADGTPLTEIVATSPSPLFDRTFRLFEIVRTSRGETVRQLIAEQRWVRTPTRADTKLVFALNRRIGSRVLELETDNGDNPAVEVVSVGAIRPVVRLVFKAPATGSTELLYGNPSAVTPRYDLGLLAQEVLAASRRMASLADVGVTAVGFSFSLGSATWVLWIVLALVVIGLLAVMTRLLPKK